MSTKNTENTYKKHNIYTKKEKTRSKTKKKNHNIESIVYTILVNT